MNYEQKVYSGTFAGIQDGSIVALMETGEAKYQKGDRIMVREANEHTGRYTGNAVYCRIVAPFTMPDKPLPPDVRVFVIKTEPSP